MNVGEIIRMLLIKLDTLTPVESDPTGELSPLSNTDQSSDELARMKQIAGLLPTASNDEYANTPQEKYADIDAVTVNAGGGINGPKHPADLRGDHTSLYPGHQHKMGNSHGS